MFENSVDDDPIFYMTLTDQCSSLLKTCTAHIPLLKSPHRRIMHVLGHPCLVLACTIDYF